MKFKELKVGDSFDWISPNRIYNSFFLRCVKTGLNSYVDEDGKKHKVGSINAEVFHVERSNPVTKKKSKNVFYLDGYKEGKLAAEVNWNINDKERVELIKASDAGDLGEIAAEILENHQQMAGTIYYEDVTDTQLNKWEQGFFDGFEHGIDKFIS